MEHRNKKTNSWILKVKNQIKKRIQFIVQNSKHGKENKSSETKIHPPEQNKKSRIQTNKTFCKKMSKNFWDCI